MRIIAHAETTAIAIGDLQGQKTPNPKPETLSQICRPTHMCLLAYLGFSPPPSNLPTSLPICVYLYLTMSFPANLLTYLPAPVVQSCAAQSPQPASNKWTGTRCTYSGQLCSHRTRPSSPNPFPEHIPPTRIHPALRPQRSQYPLIQEYTLNHYMKASII